MPSAAGAALRDVPVGFVVDRPGEIEAEAVDVVLAGEVGDVLDEEVAGDVVVEIDHRPPLRIAVIVGAVVDALLGDLPEDIVARAAVVVDDVQDDRDAVLVGRIDERLQIVGRTVG